MNRTTSDPSLKDVLDMHKREIMLEMNCHALGIVESFDAQDQTCTIKINYLKTQVVKTQAGNYEERQFNYPLLIDCPTVIYRGGNAGLTMPITQGDSCLVLFNDRDFDNWFAGNDFAPVATNRLHSISDGIALVGVGSLSSKLENYDSENPHLFNGDTSLKIKSDKILLENSTGKLGMILAELVDKIIALQTTPAVVGNPSLLDPATIAELNTMKTKIEGILE